MFSNKIMYVCVAIALQILFLVSCLNEGRPSLADDTNSSAITISTPQTEESAMIDNNVKLFVKGNNIASDNYVNFHTDANTCYFELPLTAIIKELGASVGWENKTTATIRFDGKEYILNTEKCSLIAKGGTINILSTPPGGTRHYKTVDEELIIDNITIRGFINMMGFNIKADYDKMVVEIK